MGFSFVNLWRLAQNSRASFRRWVLGLWVGFAVAAMVKVLVQPTIHTVYPIFAEAARNWWQDKSLYEPAPDRDLFRYSPTFAVLMTPFALWPHWLGGLLWVGMNVGLLWVILKSSAGEIFPGLSHPDRKALWLILTLLGSARSLWAGQSNSLILVMAIAAMMAIARERWWWASLLLAGAGFIKVWPWALSLLAIACWPRQLLGRIAVSLLFWATIPFFTKPPQTVLWQYAQWFHMLHTTQIYRWGGYRDAWTIWELLHNPVPREWYELLQCESALLVLGWCLWQRQQLSPYLLRENHSLPWVTGLSTSEAHRKEDGSALELPEGQRPSEGFGRMAMSLLGAWSAWQLLFGPGTERLTYILIAPMAAWALVTSYQSGRYRAWALAGWILITLFSMGAFERLVVKITPWGRALLPTGVIIFTYWLLLHQTLPGPLWRNVFAKVPPFHGT